MTMTVIKGISGLSILGIGIAGSFGAGADLQLLGGLLGAVLGTAIFQS